MICKNHNKFGTNAQREMHKSTLMLISLENRYLINLTILVLSENAQNANTGLKVRGLQRAQNSTFGGGPLWGSFWNTCCDHFEGPLGTFV